MKTSRILLAAGLLLIATRVHAAPTCSAIKPDAFNRHDENVSASYKQTVWGEAKPATQPPKSTGNSNAVSERRGR